MCWLVFENPSLYFNRVNSIVQSRSFFFNFSNLSVFFHDCTSFSWIVLPASLSLSSSICHFPKTPCCKARITATHTQPARHVTAPWRPQQGSILISRPQHVLAADPGEAGAEHGGLRLLQGERGRGRGLLQGHRTPGRRVREKGLLEVNVWNRISVCHDRMVKKTWGKEGK